MAEYQQVEQDVLGASDHFRCWRRWAKGETSRMRPLRRKGRVCTPRVAQQATIFISKMQGRRKRLTSFKKQKASNGIWLPVTVNVFPISVTCNRFLYLIIITFKHCYNPKLRNQSTRARLSPTVLPRGERVDIQHITKAELKSYHTFRILPVCLTP